MPAFHFEFLVEEPSMESFLCALLPRLLPKRCSYNILVHRGKEDLLRKLDGRLRAYANWIPSGYRIAIIVDCDKDDCHELKARLESICIGVGLRSKQAARAAGSLNWRVVTRIAIEELEAWYFGDWSAIRKAYPRISENVPRRSKYRNPDAIKGGTSEAFEHVMKEHGYSSFRKTEAAARIGKHIDPASNNSRSFAVFRDAIVEAVA